LNGPNAVPEALMSLKSHDFDAGDVDLDDAFAKHDQLQGN
jgi:hypothetical protein